MNSRITRLGIGLIVAYLVLFLQLNNIQVRQADRLNNHPENFRNVQRDFDQPRGLIASADGVVLAESVPTPDGAYERVRRYPETDLFGQITGYLSLEFGADGVERALNDELAGKTRAQQFSDLRDLFVDRDHTGDVTLTLRRDLQAVARDSLGPHRGSVVVLDPRSGEALVLWSWPSFDPNQLSTDDLDAARSAREALLADPSNPLLAKPYRETYAPGSTFKVVTAASALQAGVATLREPVFPVSDGYVPPASSAPLGNFAGGSCGGNLVEILRDSCNTAFAELGAEVVGPDRMVATAVDFGFNTPPPLDLPGVEPSRFPTDFGALISGPGGARSVYENSAALAQSSIGQNDVAATPLQMALVAAAVANGGRIATPHVLREIRDREGKVVRAVKASVWREAVSAATAAELRQAMEAVVEDGTGRSLQFPGFVVGAKTGTAQVSADSDATHAWVIGYAGQPGRAPALAFAVVVEAEPGGAQQTGGGVAIPVARPVLEAALNVVARAG